VIYLHCSNCSSQGLLRREFLFLLFFNTVIDLCAIGSCAIAIHSTEGGIEDIEQYWSEREKKRDITGEE